MERKALVSIQERLKLSPHWKNRWILLESFIYYRWEKGSNDFIKVHKGFVFDWASTSKYIRWIPFVGTPMDTDTLIWALVHDYCYKYQLFKREECDNLFNEIMEVMDVNYIKRILYYLWVRLWGGIPYNRYKKKFTNSL